MKGGHKLMDKEMRLRFVILYQIFESVCLRSSFPSSLSPSLTLSLLIISDFLISFHLFRKTMNHFPWRQLNKWTELRVEEEERKSFKIDFYGNNIQKQTNRRSRREEKENQKRIKREAEVRFNNLLFVRLFLLIPSIFHIFWFPFVLFRTTFSFIRYYYDYYNYDYNFLHFYFRIHHPYSLENSTFSPSSGQ